jgi:outer membrane protein assembly factor BamB
MRLALAFLISFPLFAQSWNQWAGGPGHLGSLPLNAHRLDELLAEDVYDPFVAQERQEAGGVLLVHYQAPLSDGDEIFMAVKGGTYTGFHTWESQTWGVRKYRWQNGELVQQWTAMSDWDPAPSGGPRFEPVFHAALANGFVYMPAAGGTVFEINRTTGALTRRLGQLDPTLSLTHYVISPLTVDANGNLFYNTLKFAATNPWSTNPEAAWLVKITPQGTATRVSYTTLVPGAPAPTDVCTGEFPASTLPWPPSPTATAPSITCGAQRAGINVAPAVAPDGTVYTVSRAHFNMRWGWLVAVNNNLTPKWAVSLRNRLHDGCNVLLPPNGDPGGCRNGATTGVDPADNQPGSGGVNDNSTSSPIVAPDGTIYYGTYTRYNHSQGHLMRFSASGEFLSAYKFGWDVTPAIWQHDDTFSILTKENRYEGVGTYCNTFAFCAPARVEGDEEGYYITQLSPELNVEWQYKSTNTFSCERQADGTVACQNDHPGGFEWCVNSLAVDQRGVVYVNSEDGNLYAINQGGTMRQRIFLRLALGAAYTPLSLGTDGKIYTQNAGTLFVVGSLPAKRRAARP